MSIERNLINVISIKSKFDLFRRLFKFGFLDSSNPKIIEMYNLCILIDVLFKNNKISEDMIFIEGYDSIFENLMYDISLKYLEKGD